MGGKDKYFAPSDSFSNEIIKRIFSKAEIK
jgi:hypothetical protein